MADHSMCSHGNDPWDVCVVCNSDNKIDNKIVQTIDLGEFPGVVPPAVALVNSITVQELLELLNEIPPEDRELRVLIGNNCCTSRATMVSKVTVINQEYIYISNKAKNKLPTGLF